MSDPAGKPSEQALTAFWQDPTPERACDYLAALLPVLRGLRKTERKVMPPEALPPLVEAFQVGPYTLDAILGHGADGLVLRAHSDAGDEVALKLHARGDALLADHLAYEDTPWPPQLVETYATGVWGSVPWAARELADETLHDYLGKDRNPEHDCLGKERECDTRDVFRVACEGVAWLHQHHVYGWSAHSKNVYRVGDEWKIGDFGRVWIFVPPDYPSLEARRQELLDSLGADNAEARQVADWLYARHHFGHWTASGLLPYDPEREQRLKLDDCAMLAGLLVEMLTGRRWEWFFRALNKRPYCSAVYPLTGDITSDRRLSAVLNRCWRGDAGGAPLLANGERGEQTVYDDPLELLADVLACLG